MRSGVKMFYVHGPFASNCIVVGTVSQQMPRASLLVFPEQLSKPEETAPVLMAPSADYPDIHPQLSARSASTASELRIIRNATKKCIIHLSSSQQTKLKVINSKKS